MSDTDDIVDVVVCVHNALPFVQQCLESVLAHAGHELGRLIVVDDGSDDVTATALATRFGSELTLVRNRSAKGFTRAANQGLKLADAPFTVLLNSDTQVPAGWLSRLLAAMHSHPDVGLAGPLSNAATWQSVPYMRDKAGRWAINSLPAGFTLDSFDELIHSLGGPTYPQVPLLNGFCLMINRRVIDKIGYLDEANFPRGYGEENDFCLRAGKAGYCCAIADHLYVYHAKSKSYGHLRRWWYSRQGGRRLHRIYGVDGLRQATAVMQAQPHLEQLRSRLIAELNL